MPIYAYRCDDCGFAEDVLQKMSDPPRVVCPSCGHPTLKKQVTAAGFQLKGSGWYVTDFRNPAAKETKKTEGDGPATDAAKPAATDAAAPASDGAKADAKSETKAAPAPAPTPPATSPSPKSSGGDGA